jgi:hypothetical protein
MARCSSLDEAARVVGVEDLDEVLLAAELERAFVEEPALSSASEGVPSEGAATYTHYFRASTISVGKINEMEERLFCEGRGSRVRGRNHARATRCQSYGVHRFICCWFAHASASSPG